MSAVDSAAPSIKPTVSALTSITVVKNTGSRLWIISEEISISMLTKPSAQMLRGIRFGVLATDCEAESLAPPDIVSRKTGLTRQRWRLWYARNVKAYRDMQADCDVLPPVLRPDAASRHS